MKAFLYPTSCQFPFDEVCRDIVLELEKRNWQVPGIDVEFTEYGSGEDKFRAVSVIKNRDVHLHFCRKQRTLPGGRFNDVAAVTRLVIPKKELNVFEDESGPTFYLYVGNDYEREREQFMNGLKVNSKLNGKPKTYLQYRGQCQCGIKGFAGKNIPHSHPGERSSLLVHTNDLGREYDPEGDEPSFFFTSPVMDEFRQYLQETVLKTIMSCPIPSEKIDRFAEAQPIPFPRIAILGELFCFAEYCDASRIMRGKANPNDLHPADRYGLTNSGYRLMPLDIPSDGKVPEIAYEGFLWCGITPMMIEGPIDTLEIPGHHRWLDSERYVVRIKPDRANDIFIADHAPYEKRRKELADSLGNRDRFTEEEVADFTRARARTIVPINEYKGGYEQPIVLINRELSFDEVEVVSGPREDKSSLLIRR